MAIGQHVAKALAERAAEQEHEIPMERPPRVSEPADPSMATVMQSFADLIKELRSANTSEQKEAAISQAELMQQLLVKTKPENVAPPRISVFNPSGDRDHPKPPLKCEMFWVGYDLRPEVLTPEEVDLMNRLEPGEYVVMKADRTQIPLTVTAKRNSNLKLERLDVWFPCKGQDRHNHGSMESYLRQVLGESIPTADELMTELTRLKQELKLSQMGAGA